MADNKYKLKFAMSDGSTQEVEFTAPQGEQGPPGKDAPQESILFVAQTLTDEQKTQARKNLGFVRNFKTFPTEAEVNAMSNWDYFETQGFYSEIDGHGCLYQVNTTGGNFYIPHGNMYIRPVAVDSEHRDILVDWYGIRRGSADYAVRNSEIMSHIASTLPNGYTLNFASGHYYFAEPIPHMERHVCFKGVCANACAVVDTVNYGTYLHFPNLADGEAAISIQGGVVQDIGIIGNPDVCNVSIDRAKVMANRDEMVNLVDTGTTYGIKLGSWGYTVQNVRIRNCTYGIYSETGNALITNIDTHKCKIGISIGNDIKVNNVQVWDVMVGVQLRGQLASATNIRGDSVGKHLVECWAGKCLLTNIDGDGCVGSLIHYGDGTKKHIHLGQATACMGRVALRTGFTRSSEFDLRNVSDADYEYCSYISIAPYTQVFGGHIDISNVKAIITDSASEYVHPDAPISIGTGSTVKGVTIKCNVPYDADLDYFNKQVIKNLSTNAESENSATEYVSDFDGTTVEDINFITPIGFIRSKRSLGALDRVLEYSNVANDAVLYEKQDLTEAQKAQARKNVGLDNISSLEFVASIDSCTDSNKTYVLPDGRTVAYAEKPSFTNQLPISIDSTGAIYNAADTPGYKHGRFNGYNESSASLWYITGFIPVRTGDIIRLENVRVIETDTNVIAPANTNCVFKFYNQDFTGNITSNTYAPGQLPSAAWEPVYDSTGNIIQFKIPTSYSANIRYMRMCVRSITQDSIITVNEVIEPPKAEFGDTGLRFVTEDMYKKIEALLAQ